MAHLGAVVRKNVTKPEIVAFSLDAFTKGLSSGVKWLFTNLGRLQSFVYTLCGKRLSLLEPHTVGSELAFDDFEMREICGKFARSS
jgi:hypothetical protein